MHSNAEKYALKFCRKRKRTVNVQKKEVVKRNDENENRGTFFHAQETSQRYVEACAAITQVAVHTNNSRRGLHDCLQFPPNARIGDGVPGFQSL